MRSSGVVSIDEKYCSFRTSCSIMVGEVSIPRGSGALWKARLLNRLNLRAR
jgi:hypothetical protein